VHGASFGAYRSAVGTVLADPLKMVFEDANDVPFQPFRARILPRFGPLEET
jgi:hypothetical protein